MKTIYTVNENYQDSDMDDWGHWVSHKVISYHSSEENAKKAIQKYLQKLLQENEDFLKAHVYEYTKHIHYYEKRVKEINENKRPFEVGRNHDMELNPFYFIGSVQLMD